MVDRKLDELQGRSQRLPERPVGHLAGSLPVGEPAPAGRGWSASVAGLSPRALWKSHRLFSILVILSLLPRVLADLAFRPALLIADSFGYMQEGTTLSLGKLRPSRMEWPLGRPPMVRRVRIMGDVAGRHRSAIVA